MDLTRTVEKHVTISHWFPIITRCPLSIWPDFVYVELDYKILGDPPELYAVRKTIRQTIQWKKAYMEDLAATLANTKELKNGLVRVRVCLPFYRHVAEIQLNRRKHDVF